MHCAYALLMIKTFLLLLEWLEMFLNPIFFWTVRGWLEFTSVQLVEGLVLSCLTPDNHRCDRFYSYLNIRTLANRNSYSTSYETKLVLEILISLQNGLH